MSGCTKEMFIKEFSEKLKCEKASLFIGSGISRKAGYANWKDILRECAEEIGLNVDKENDLITLAEFYVKDRQRTKITQTISDFFQDNKGNPVRTHEILATFPVKSIWTTNYDTLIERSLKKADISYSVVTDDESYTGLDPTAKIKIHKIHGDVKSPSHCVITRKDYEKFEEQHDIVLSELKGEMCTNSFLFLGYSFSDIDIQHILSKIRLIYKEDHPQRHYCIIKKINQSDCVDRQDYEYKIKRQGHHIKDMQSYGLNVVLVDSFDEIDEILEQVSLRVQLKNVLISGAYELTNSNAEIRISPVANKLSEKLIQCGYKIVTGYGKNLGSDIVTGAFRGCKMSNNKSKDFNENVFLFPFPYKLSQSDEKDKIYEGIRENMISKTRIAIFICGEKAENNSTINSPGTLKEYKISKSKENLIIPLATTGAAAQYIWDLENRDKTKSTEFDEFQKLGKEINPDKIVEIIINMIEKYSENYK